VYTSTVIIQSFMIRCEQPLTAQFALAWYCADAGTIRHLDCYTLSTWNCIARHLPDSLTLT